MTGWTALVLAGQRPGPDPLAMHFGQRWKALVPVAGEAMLSRVARTLLACPEVVRVVVVAQAPDALLVGGCAWLAAEPRVATARSDDGIAASVSRIAGGADAPWPVLVTTADHPLLTPPMVAALLAGATADVTVGVVERATLLAAHPGNRRTWLRFRGGAWTGANLFALRGPATAGALAAWGAVERDRKKAWRLLWRLGPVLALRAATRTVTLAGALAAAGHRLGCTAAPAALPFAEAGIDVDKPADHQLAERILAARQGPPAQG